jgi:hypothetical protein
MHTEHLQNVHPARVFFGWFVSVAIVSLIVLALIAVRLLSPDATGGDLAWGVAAIAAGFFAGGWLTGARGGTAPILHGIAMGLVSLVVWFVANLLAGEALGATTWAGNAGFYTGILIVQMGAAAAGALVGVRGWRGVARG